jgi:hypothetical protein
MTRTAVKQLVKSLLNEHQPFETGSVVEAGNAPTKPVDKYIEDSVDLCMESLIQTAPVELLTTRYVAGTLPGSNTYPVGRKRYGQIALDGGYLRFGSLYLTSWRQSVRSLSDVRWLNRQFFEHTMTTASHPCVYEQVVHTLSETPTGEPPSGEPPTVDTKMVLMVFPATLGDAYQLHYIPRYDWKLSDTVETGAYIKDSLIDSLVNAIGMRALIYFGRDANGLASLYRGASLAADAIGAYSRTGKTPYAGTTGDSG